ncbi:hypothetical protein [Actinomadura sp. K4S16]|uniref:hypothetical protein n=1 Tax=Actinomadura sp. K4S16 TaxID=1316147 RepID=UPI0011EDE833|nr:hypothetical protein [Actinomadura sp. K4S16]
MLDVAQALLDMLPQQRTETADSLKRSMVWMRKYIGPTSEYWDWVTFEEPIDQSTNLRVSFIGLGWILVLKRHFVSGVVSPALVERELATAMDHITQNIPLEAVLRLRAKPWDQASIARVYRYLNNAGHAVENERTNPHVIKFDGFEITLDDGETLVSKAGISNQLDLAIKKSLRDVKRWANDEGRFEGADWCAYKRRRLTTVVQAVADLTPSEGDFEFTNDPSGDYRRSQQRGFDRISLQSSPDKPFCSIVFPAYSYHQGILNPRMMIRTTEEWNSESVEIVARYYSYLWVNHYTRLWRYLEFEDQFTYTSDVRRIRELDEDSYYSYGRRMRAVDTLRAGIELGNRIDEGKVAAYRPPHDVFCIEAGVAHDVSMLERLRTTLISSTVTSLKEDPLRRAPEVLEHAVRELGRSYENFAQAASLRMQRSLQILQVVLLVGALAPFLLLVPIPEVIDSAAVHSSNSIGLYRDMRNAKQSQAWLRDLDLSLYTFRLLCLVSLTVGSLLILRARKTTALLRRFFE